MTIADKEKVQRYVCHLSRLTLENIAVLMIEHLEETGHLGIREDGTPYWDSCGDALVEGDD